MNSKTGDSPETLITAVANQTKTSNQPKSNQTQPDYTQSNAIGLNPSNPTKSNPTQTNSIEPDPIHQNPSQPNPTTELSNQQLYEAVDVVKTLRNKSNLICNCF